MKPIIIFLKWITSYSFVKFFESVIIPYGFTKLADNLSKNRKEIDKEYNALLAETCNEFQQNNIDAFGGNIEDYLLNNEDTYKSLMKLIWNFSLTNEEDILTEIQNSNSIDVETLKPGFIKNFIEVFRSKLKKSKFFHKHFIEQEQYNTILQILNNQIKQKDERIMIVNDLKTIKEQISQVLSIMNRNGEYDKSILKKIKDTILNVIALHGLDDENWAKALSSQYFLVKTAKLIGLEHHKDYESLLNRFLSSFNLKIDSSILLNDNHILVTPEELDKIVECMKNEDHKDNYYTQSNKTKAENIDPMLLHYNYLYGLTLEISNSDKYEILKTIHNLAIKKLIFAEYGHALDDYGGWYPYRIPWITARILISFKNAKIEEKDNKHVLEIIEKGLESLISRIYKGKYWRSGVGDWVSNWESTGLCLEALYEWDYIKAKPQEVFKVLKYITNNQDDWLELNPNFSSDIEANNTLASIILITTLLKISNRNSKFTISDSDLKKYFDYLFNCMTEITNNCSIENRQFCTIPQITYYISSLIYEIEE